MRRTVEVKYQTVDNDFEEPIYFDFTNEGFKWVEREVKRLVYEKVNPDLVKSIKVNIEYELLKD